jgi:hypothetical protein
MPNGKAGDDWFTDIVAHDLPTFSPEADRLIVEIAANSPGSRHQALDSLVDEFLGSIGYEELASRGTHVGMEYRNLRPDERAALERKLQTLRDSISGAD